MIVLVRFFVRLAVWGLLGTSWGHIWATAGAIFGLPGANFRFVDAVFRVCSYGVSSLFAGPFVRFSIGRLSIFDLSMLHWGPGPEDCALRD